MADKAAQAEIDALLKERAALTVGATDSVTSTSFTPTAGVNAPTPEAQAEIDALLKERASMALVPKNPLPAPPATGTVQLSGEAPPDAEPDPGMWPEALTPQRFSKSRRPDLEDLPDLIRAPAVHSMAGVAALGTIAGADEIEKILKTNNPGTKVETTPEGYKVYQFPGDPQKYAWKPGVRLSDIARMAPGAAIGTGASLLAAPAAAASAASVPIAMGTSAIMAVLGELMQKHYGGDINLDQIMLAGAIPAVAPVARGIAGGVAKLARAITAPVGQTVEDIAPSLMNRAKSLFTSWGADPDASALGQKLANITQPAVDQAETAAVSATANTEAATAAANAKAEQANIAAGNKAEAGTASAAAKAEAGTLAATTRAEDATATAAAQAREARLATRAKAQGAMAGIATRAEQDDLAANAPIAEVYDQAGQALKKWGAMGGSSLDKKFMDRVRGFLKDSTKRADALFKQLENGMPKKAPVTPRPELDNALEWVAGELEGQGKLPSPMLKKAQLLLAPEVLESGEVVPPEIGTITQLRKLASAAGFRGDFANELSGTGKKLADYLTKIEYSVAKDYGMDDLMAKARSEVAGRKVTERGLKQALTIKGAQALNATVVPLIDATGKAMQKGNAEPLRRLISIIPKGMEGEVMATTVQRAMLDSAPADPVKAVQHIADFVNNLKADKVIGPRVLGMLPEEARQGVLSMGKDAEAALSRRSADLAASEAEQAAATRAAQQAKDAELAAIQQKRTEEGLAIRRQKAAELAAVGHEKASTIDALGREKTAALAATAQEKAGTIAAAKGAEGAAKSALTDAEAANISLAPTMKSAGNALLAGDVKPYKTMMKTLGGRLPPSEVAASTLYHTVLDPAKAGTEGLGGLAKGLTELEANPQARSQLLASLPATADRSLKDLAQLSRVVHSGTAAGAQKAEDFLGRMAAMGAWVSGKTGALIGGGLGAAVGGPVGGVLGGGGGFLAGRMLSSALNQSRSAVTKAANAFFASEGGKELLQRLALDAPITPGLLQKVGQNGAFRWFVSKAGIPRGEAGRWLDQAVNAGAKRALTVNRTEEQ